MTVQLSDIFEPTTFTEAIDEAASENNAFIAAGVAVSDANIEAMASQGGRIGELPFYKPLETAEPNYSDDDSSHVATPKKITGGKQVYRLASMNQAWSAMDLARELTSQKDPVAAITSKIGGYWATQIEKRVISSCLGILADNVANDSGDMVVDLATDDAGAPTDAELISAEAVIDAQTTMGDAADALTAIAVHSVVYSRLKKLNLIDFIPDSEGVVNIPTYLGMRLVVDDALPAVAGTNRVTYTSILFGLGAMVNASGRTLYPVEYERKPSSGNGGGEEVIYSRRSEIIHPYGFEFTSSSVVGVSATLSELETAANWDRVYADRKSVSLAFLQTNG
jgi:hypothetical protein